MSTSTRTPIRLPAATAAADSAAASIHVIDGDGEANLAGQERGRPSLGRIDELVGDEDVVGPGASHDDGFPDRRGAQPERAVLELHARDVRALVVLDMTTEAGMQRRQLGLHEREIGLEDVAIDDERRA